MTGYRIYCQGPDCHALAEYKIAAFWSDGQVRELKTYDLVCEKCLPAAFDSSRIRQSIVQRAPGEILDVPHIYRLSKLNVKEAPTPDLEAEEKVQKISANSPSL